MVPKLFSSGKSFAKLAAYLLHDPEKAETAERIRWSHTLNLASDHPALAVNEMLWTYRSADELKRQAGLKAGGRRLENPVRHFSLNWHPSQSPTREHMIETVEGFLKHMKWQEYQALIVCHDDKHPHVHVMVNAVHPDTGRALDNSYERRRAQEWAKQYEREHGQIFCEERLKPAHERTPSPTRATWQKLRAYEKEDDRAEQAREKEFDYFERGGKTEAQAREWKALKAHQKAERQQFFAEGKQLYREARNEAYREVRAEFTMDWRIFYRDKRAGWDKALLAERKAEILKRQSAALDERRTEACGVLREHRDEEYRQLLIDQQQARRELHKRQNDGLSSYHLLDRMYPEPWQRMRDEPVTVPPGPLQRAFRRAAKAATERRPAEPKREPREAKPFKPKRRRAHLKLKLRKPLKLGLGALGALATIGERLFDGLLGGGEKTEPPRFEAPADPIADEREAAQHAVTVQAANEVLEADEARSKAAWRDKRRRRERD